MKFFFDTYAIIEIIKENEEYNKYKEEEIITSILNIGELYYALYKDYSEEIAEEWYNKLKNMAINIDIEIIVKAMKFRLKNKEKKLSFIDCVGYILAKELKIKFLTGDKEFKNLDNVEFVR